MATIKNLLDGKGYDVWSVHPEDTVFKALECMAEKNIGELLLEICINVVTAAIKSLLQPERFSIRPELP